MNVVLICYYRFKILEFATFSDSFLDIPML